MHESTIEKALRLRAAGDFDNAITVLQNSQQEAEQEPYIFLLLGLSYMNTSRLVIAIGFYYKYIAFDTTSSLAWYLIAFCIHKYTSYTDALPFFRKAIFLGFDDPDLWLWYGEALMRSGYYRRSLRALKKSLNSDSKPCDLNRAYSFFFRSASLALKHDAPKPSYHDALVAQIKSLLGIDEIICVGDSHTLILEHIRSLVVVQTGSPTAYNLLDPSSTESGLPKIRQALEGKDPTKTALIFTYAEIDIRYHIHKHAAIRGMAYSDAVSVVVSRYVEVLDYFSAGGFTVLVNGPFGTGVGVPRVGPEVDRNVISLLIDQQLKREAGIRANFFYASLIDIIVDENMLTSRAFVGEVDDNHLDKVPELSFCLLSRFLSQIKTDRIDPNQLNSPTYKAASIGEGLVAATVNSCDGLNALYIVKHGGLQSLFNEPEPGSQQLLIALSESTCVSRISFTLKENRPITDIRCDMADGYFCFHKSFSIASSVIKPGYYDFSIDIDLNMVATWYIKLKFPFAINPVNLQHFCIKALEYTVTPVSVCHT